MEKGGDEKGEKDREGGIEEEGEKDGRRGMFPHSLCAKYETKCSFS